MRVLIPGWVLLAFFAVTHEKATAYPYYQLSSGTDRCNLCHFAPAGGGLLNNWGRQESADTLSRGGNGEFLHGLTDLPDWIALGGDVRVAMLVNDSGDPEGTEFAVFPMQADFAARVAVQSFSVVANIGVRGAARSTTTPPGSNRAEGSTLSRLISREHYVQWMPKQQGLYARIGRFYAPFGLRLPDHTAYVRRYMGFNLLEETYGLSGGYVGRNLDIHVTGYISDRLRWAPRKEAGVTIMMERRHNAFIYGASQRYAFAEDDKRMTGGGFAKHWWEKSQILWMAELYLTHQSFDLVDADRWQLAAYVGPTWIPTQGVYLGTAYELFDEDIAKRNVERHRLGGWVSYQPLSHIEIMWSGRVQWIGSDSRTFVSLLQLHYYL